MARKYLSMSANQKTRTRASSPDVISAPFVDSDARDFLGALSADGAWPLFDDTLSPLSGQANFVADDVVRMPRGLRAISLAPHTDLDVLQVKFGEEDWQMLGPGRAVYPKTEPEYIRVRPAYAMVDRNMTTVGGNVVVLPQWYGDGVIELWFDETPHVVPKLLPVRSYLIKSFALTASSVDATSGNPMTLVIATPAYNVERAMFTFAEFQGKHLRAAFAQMGPQHVFDIAGGRAPAGLRDYVTEPYQEIVNNTGGGYYCANGNILLTDIACAVLGVYAGLSDAVAPGYSTADGFLLNLVRRFIG